MFHTSGANGVRGIPYPVGDLMGPKGRKEAKTSQRMPFKARAELSEITLGQGFTLEPIAPLRPGYFSGNPQFRSGISQSPQQMSISGHSLEGNDKSLPHTGHKKQEVTPRQNTRGNDILPSSGSSSLRLGRRKGRTTCKERTHASILMNHYDSPDELHGDENARDDDRPYPLALEKKTSPEKSSILSNPHSTSDSQTLPAGFKISSTFAALQDHCTPQTKSNASQDNFQPLKHMPIALRSRVVPEPFALNHSVLKSSPRSQCGDLQLPGIHGQPHERCPSEKSSILNKPNYSPNYKSRKRHHPERSQSQASNVSRKRCKLAKKPIEDDNFRREQAMRKIAQYWNECTSISQEERNKADSEIAGLRNGIQELEEKVKESASYLQEREDKIKEVENKHQKTQDVNSHILHENDTLIEQIEALRLQVSGFDAKETSVSNRQKAFRSKLNEAITEQQDLYLRSNGYYTEMMQKIESAQSEINVEAIQQALKKSRETREEQKKCMERLQDQVKTDKQLNDMAMSQLRSKIEEKDRELNLLKQSTNRLQEQAVSNEATQEKLDEIKAKMRQLIEQTRNKENEDIDQLRLLQQLLSRIDDVETKLQSAKQPALSAANIETAVTLIGEKVVDRLLPVIEDSMARQPICQTSLSDTAGKIEKCVISLYDLIQAPARNSRDDRIRPHFPNRNHDNTLAETLGKMGSAQLAHGYGHMSTKEWSTSNAASQEHEFALLYDKMAKEFQRRNDSIKSHQDQLQSSMEDCTLRIQYLTASIDASGEDIHSDLRDAIADFHRTIQSNFLSRKQEYIEELQSLGKEKRGPESQLSSVKAELEEWNQAERNARNVQESLVAERKTAGHLRDQIQILEHNARETQKLKKHWVRDIQSLATIRSQMKKMNQIFPHSDDFNQKVEALMQSKTMLQLTHEYLTKEHQWVHKELRHRNGLDGGVIDPEVQNISQHFLVQKNEQVGASLNIEHRKTMQNKDISTENGKLTSLSEGNAVNRRVTVHSPGGGSVIRSQQVSVVDEKVNRRMAARPRSILKQKSLNRLPNSRQAASVSKFIGIDGPQAMAIAQQSA